jgi:hypothetical protein
MNKRHLLSRAFLLALIPLIMLLFHNQLSNWHYHMLGNGMMVKHAHPYSKAENSGSPFSNHTHSDFEFLLFGQLSNISLILVFLLFTLFSAGTFIRKLLISKYPFPFLTQYYLSLNFLRAPPRNSFAS